MRKRCVINVATDGYISWQKRLLASLDRVGRCHEIMKWTNILPPGSPTHREWSYAFKLYALKEAEKTGHEVVF